MQRKTYQASLGGIGKLSVPGRREGTLQRTMSRTLLEGVSHSLESERRGGYSLLKLTLILLQMEKVIRIIRTTTMTIIWTAIIPIMVITMTMMKCATMTPVMRMATIVRTAMIIMRKIMGNTQMNIRLIQITIRTTRMTTRKVMLMMVTPLVVIGLSN